ncbi:hypothetical protein pb186bvf_004124 [Paramecium bursaria]
MDCESPECTSTQTTKISQKYCPETDYLPENVLGPDEEVQKHNFVIGVIKPGERRVGLQTINKNKISISGVLGIKKF